MSLYGLTPLLLFHISPILPMPILQMKSKLQQFISKSSGKGPHLDASIIRWQARVTMMEKQLTVVLEPFSTAKSHPSIPPDAPEVSNLTHSSTILPAKGFKRTMGRAGEVQHFSVLEADD